MPLAPRRIRPVESPGLPFSVLSACPSACAAGAATPVEAIWAARVDSAGPVILVSAGPTLGTAF